MRKIDYRAWDGEKMLYMNENERPDDFFLHAKIKADIFGKEVMFMQSAGITGLTVYEGDITEDMMGYGIIKFHEGSFVIDYGNGATDFLTDCPFKVIGNIFENPDWIDKVF